MAQVFISYAREDQPFVRRLNEALTNRGQETWVDWEGIPPVARWLSEIQSAIEAADAFVFVLSPASASSEVCRRELSHAAAHRKRLVPLVRAQPEAPSVPTELAELNWVFFRDSEDFDAALATLIGAIETDLENVHRHTRLLVQARAWEDRGRVETRTLRGHDLEEAEAWLRNSADKEPKPTALQTEFVAASRHATDRRSRIIVTAASLAAIVATVLAVLAWMQRAEALHQGRVALSRQLAAQSRLLLGKEMDLSILGAVAAHRVEDTLQSRAALLHVLEQYRTSEFRLQPIGFVAAVKFSPDGNLLAIGGCANDSDFECETGEVHVWNLTKRMDVMPALRISTLR